MHFRKYIKSYFRALNNATADLQAYVVTQYKQDCKAFQNSYNEKNPLAHIWIHGHRERTIRFFVGSRVHRIKISLLRFKDSQTGKTFTFYGGFFVPRLKYAICYVVMAIYDYLNERAYQKEGHYRGYRSLLCEDEIAEYDIVSQETKEKWSSDDAYGWLLDICPV